MGMNTRQILATLLAALLGAGTSAAAGEELVRFDFETGDLSQWDSSLVEAGGLVEAIPAAARGGAYGLHVQTSEGGEDDAHLRAQIPEVMDLYARVKVKLNSDISQGAYQTLITAATDRGGEIVGAVKIRSRAEDPANSL